MLIFLLGLASAEQLVVKKCSEALTKYQLVPSDGTTPKEQAEFSQFTICQKEGVLVVDFFNIDNYIINPLKNCNEAIYKYDANEVFIGNAKDYFEIEVSPFSGLFYAKIHNQNSDCTKLDTFYQDCTLLRGYGYVITPNNWISHLEIPIPADRPLMANFFRVNKQQEKTEYLSYSPTLAKPACFHHPEKFIELVL